MFIDFSSYIKKREITLHWEEMRNETARTILDSDSAQPPREGTSGGTIWEELVISILDFSAASKNNRAFQILTFTNLQGPFPSSSKLR